MAAASEEVQNGAFSLQAVVNRKLSFYTVDSSTIDENARALLIKHSGLAPDEVGPHVDAIVSHSVSLHGILKNVQLIYSSQREKAFAIYPYPCIGMYRFLDLSIVKTKVYSEVVQRLKSGEKILDLGCCFGQEIRQLVRRL
jgi:hypothetical protein